MKRSTAFAILFLTVLPGLAIGQTNQEQVNKSTPRVPDDVSIQSNVIFGKHGGRDFHTSEIRKMEMDFVSDLFNK